MIFYEAIALNPLVAVGLIVLFAVGGWLAARRSSRSRMRHGMLVMALASFLPVAIVSFLTLWLVVPDNTVAASTGLLETLGAVFRVFLVILGWPVVPLVAWYLGFFAAFCTSVRGQAGGGPAA